MLEKYTNIPSGSEQYSPEFIEENGVLLLEKKDKYTRIAVSEKTTEKIRNTLLLFHRGKTYFVFVQSEEISSWLARELGKERDKPLLKESGKNATLIDKVANDAPAVNFVNAVCMDGIRGGASDIHIESGIEYARVRYRIDGVLKTVAEIESGRFESISSRIKIMANLNILEKRQPQDGRITVALGNEKADLRVSIIPVFCGESIVLRILGKSSSLLKLNDLGFSKEQLCDIYSMMKIPHGLILVTGPTGSGKTTTLNAMMREMSDEKIKIVSIEDPVEFVVDGVNQIQINEQIGLGFDSILRRVLRQDPNVIMVGEIRDKATAELSVRAALTGHLVLSTIHTNDAAGSITRLRDMGIEPFLIASVLKGTIAQRLVRKYSAEKEKFEGRIIISETFRTDDKLSEIISTDCREKAIRDYLAETGMCFLKDDALKKISLGLTTRAEAEREIIF